MANPPGKSDRRIVKKPKGAVKPTAIPRDADTGRVLDLREDGKPFQGPAEGRDTNKLRVVRHRVPDLRRQDVRAAIANEARLLAAHPDNAALDDWVDTARTIGG